MGAFSDKNGVFSSNGYKVTYNNERIMFKNNSAKNLFSQTRYFPEGQKSSGSPITEDPVVPNYVNDISYLFFNMTGGDQYIYPTFSENVTNASHLFLGISSGIASNFDPNNGRHGIHYPNSIINAAGMFKDMSTLSNGMITNFIRNCPSSIVDMNNTFFYVHSSTNNAFFPIKDENNNYILDNYKNLFDTWHDERSLYSSSSYFSGGCNDNAYNGDKRYLDTMVPDSVIYMNGTFALSSIECPNYDRRQQEPNLDFHLSNNVKDASFCFFNSYGTGSYSFNLPDSLTEANYMFATLYGYAPKQVRFGNGLVNAVGMFAQFPYSYASVDNIENLFPEGLPNTIINASKMFYGINFNNMVPIPRSVEDASFFLGFSGWSGSSSEWQNNIYTIPNTVKNIDFIFANTNICPNNNNWRDFFNDYKYTPERWTFSYMQKYNNTYFVFEEGSQLNSVKGMFAGAQINKNIEIPNAVKDISFFLCNSGVNLGNIENGEISAQQFINNILKENVENAAWAFSGDYCYNDLDIYLPNNLKNIEGMLGGVFTNGEANYNIFGLENLQINSVAYLLYGCYGWNKPINFPNTIENLYRTFDMCSNFTGHYDGWTFNLEQYPNLKNCDYTFRYCSNLNIPLTFPEGLESLEGTFNSCYNFDQYVGIPSSVKSTAYLFSDCRNFNYGGHDLDFSNLTNLIDMSYMFNNCKNLNKVINEQTLKWPPHIEKISGLFSNCSNLDIETFVIPGSIKTGKEILKDVTIGNGVYIEGGYDSLINPFYNIRGKSLLDNGNYGFNSVIIECGNNGNLCGNFYFNNTEVNSLIFKDGNLGLLSKEYVYGYYQGNYQYYWNNAKGNIYISGNKFNTYINFYNVDAIYGDTGSFEIISANNYNQPVTFPPIIYNEYAASDKRYYLVLGEWPGGEYYFNNNSNYVMIVENINNIHDIKLAYAFAENNTIFKEQLNNLIYTSQDYWNILNNKDNYPRKARLNEYVFSGHGNFRVTSCQNFNSPITYSAGTEYLSRPVYQCGNFNSDISVPSSVTSIDILLYQCSNYNHQFILPGTVKYTSTLFYGCNNLNTAPLIGEGVLSLSGALADCYIFNQKVYLPNSLQSAFRLFDGCSNYNQETDFKGAVILSNALQNCFKYNSNTNFSFSNYKTIECLFANDYLFNKELDFNCEGIYSANGLLSSCSNFNSNIKNCTLYKKVSNFFNGELNYYNWDGAINLKTKEACDLQGSNVFYYRSPWDAIGNENFYYYTSSINYPNASRMFSGCSNFNVTEIPDFKNALYAVGTFDGCYKFNQPVNFYEAIAIENLFQGCSNFNQPLIFNSMVNSIGRAFSHCYNLVPIPKFLNGIYCAGNGTSYVSNTPGMNAFYGCHSMGLGQEGFDYAFHFKHMTRGNNASNWCPYSNFFRECYHLNVPIIFENVNSYGSYADMNVFPDYFLYDCHNFNSNIILTGVNKYTIRLTEEQYNNFSSNLEYEVEVDPRSDMNYYNIYFNYNIFRFNGGSYFFANCYNYNRFIEMRDKNNSPINWYFNEITLGNPSRGGSFILYCNDFNYPIQDHFRPINADYAINNVVYRTMMRTGIATYCYNFNQPILQYFFDSPESLELNAQYTAISWIDLNLYFTECQNFNQSLIGNFTFKNNQITEIYTNLCFTNCITPNDISMNFRALVLNNYRSYYGTYGFHFGPMKKPIDSPHRNFYVNVIYNDEIINKVNITFNPQSMLVGQSSNDSLSGAVGYENFMADNIYLDFYGNNYNFNIGVTTGIIQCANYFSYYYYYNQQTNLRDFNPQYHQNNQDIKVINFLPSVNNLIFCPGFTSGNIRKPVMQGTILFYVDCGNLSLWNNFLGGRQGNVYYNNGYGFFQCLRNVHEDFHFEPTSNVYFNNVHDVFRFDFDTDVNIYINSNKSFNNVSNFITTKFSDLYSTQYPNGYNSNYINFINCQVNVYIKDGLTFYNTNGFFSSSPGCNYYIGERTIFYQCTSIPKRLTSNLNLTQFQGSGYNLRDGRYVFGADLDLSSISGLTTDNLTNVLFEGSNNIIINPSTYQATGIRGCRNFMINRYYSGSTSINNIFNRRPWMTTLVNSQSWEYIDSTNTVANLYIKSGTSLATYLKQNSQRAFNIFWSPYKIAEYLKDDWECGALTIVEETSDRITYCLNTYVEWDYNLPGGGTGHSGYGNKMIVYYNLIFY